MSEPPAIVIYMIDPFSFGVDNLELQRLSSLAMMRCFSDILHDSRIPDNIRQSVYLQTVNLETVYSLGDTTDITRSTHLLRQLCLSVYTQAMRPNSFNNLAKTLTGFGPASAAERYLKSIDAKVSIEIIICEGMRALGLRDETNHTCYYRIRWCRSTNISTVLPSYWPRPVRGARRPVTATRSEAR